MPTSTPYEIRTFWYNQNIRGEAVGIGKVHESISGSEFYTNLRNDLNDTSVEKALGYTPGSVTSIMESLGKS